MYGMVKLLYKVPPAPGAPELMRGPIPNVEIRFAPRVEAPTDQAANPSSLALATDAEPDEPRLIMVAVRPEFELPRENVWESPMEGEP